MDDSIILQKVSDLTEEEKGLEESTSLSHFPRRSWRDFARLRSSSTSVGTCCADAVRVAAPVSIPTTKACDPKALSRATSSDSERLRP